MGPMRRVPALQEDAAVRVEGDGRDPRTACVEQA